MNLAKTAAVVVLAGSLAACQGAGDKEVGGTVVGAALGGLVGSQFGSGGGQLAATALGVAVGGFIGNQVGKSLDRADRLAMASAHDQALAAPVGETITWNNPDTGNYGTARTVREGATAAGAYCREYQSTVTVGGETQEAYGTACRQPDGSWKIVQ